jgi:hypothetical protein
MKRSLKTLGPLAVVAMLGTALAGCTVVTPGGGDDGGVKIIPIPVRSDALPTPKPLTASVLYVANLQRSSANLADAYSRIILGVAQYLQSVGLTLENMGLISTYADQFGPRLLLGRKADAPSSSLSLLAALAGAADAGITDYAQLLPLISGALANVSDDDLPRALKLLASSGEFEGTTETSEAKAVIDFGRNINTQALPPELGGIERSALFDHPRDLFLVVYLQPMPRKCALGTSACMVDGQDPSAVFEAVNADGTASWLAFNGVGIRPEQIVQVAVATSEGEDLTTFRTRCGKVPGFPTNLFSVIAPSPNAYFGPLMSSLNNVHRGTGQRGDFCELIGGSPDAIKLLGKSIASLAASH